jgi:hypothetical protein
MFFFFYGSVSLLCRLIDTPRIDYPGHQPSEMPGLLRPHIPSYACMRISTANGLTFFPQGADHWRGATPRRRAPFRYIDFLPMAGVIYCNQFS